MTRGEFSNEAYSRTEKLAENPFFKLFSRAAMTATCAIVIWYAGKFDDMRLAQVEINSSIKVLSRELQEKTADRWTGAQEHATMAVQERRDKAQDFDRARIEKRLDNNFDPRLLELERRTTR